MPANQVHAIREGSLCPCVKVYIPVMVSVYIWRGQGKYRSVGITVPVVDISKLSRLLDLMLLSVLL